MVVQHTASCLSLLQTFLVELCDLRWRHLGKELLCVHMLHQQVRQAMAALAKSLPRVHCLLGCHVTQLHWSLALLTDWQHLISFHGSNHSIFSSRRHVGHDQTILVACTGLIFVSMASNHVSMINSQSDKTEKPSGKLYIYIYIYCACTGWHVRSRGVSAVSWRCLGVSRRCLGGVSGCLGGVSELLHKLCELVEAMSISVRKP